MTTGRVLVALIGLGAACLVVEVVIIAQRPSWWERWSKGGTS